MLHSARRRIGFVACMAVALVAASTSGVSAAPKQPVVTFVSPSPVDRSTLTTDAATVALAWDWKPNQTRSVSCALAGPTPSSAACAPPLTATGGSRSSASYAGLANGDYAFTATVTLNSGTSTTVTRRFSVEVPQTLYALRAEYWVNSSGRYLAVQGFTTLGGVAGGAYTGPALTASWKAANGTVLGTASLAAVVDAGVYVRHRSRLRIGDPGSGGAMPATVTIAAGGQTDSVQVRPWIGTSTPHVAGFRTDFFTHYLDPVEVRSQLDSAAALYPELMSVINVPEKSSYERQAQTILGTTAPYTGSTTALAPAERSRAVVLSSRETGQNGGNQLTVWLFDPGTLNTPLSVATLGIAVAVSLATDATGAITSTAAQVVGALNADPAASALLTARTYRGDAGAGIVVPQPTSTHLSDYLSGPESVRGPFQPHLYRIGTQRDGSRVGVLITCQENAREWVTPLVCAETVEELVSNYATDPETQTLVNGLDIFVLPTANPAGALYSMYDSSAQGKTMTNTCPVSGASDPTARNSWGVAIGRNFSEGSIFDGYAGGSADCTSEDYAGSSEQSESESRNMLWVASTFPNIKFTANVTTGGSVTFAPSAYRSTGRTPLPYPGYGVQGYLRQTAQAMVTGVNGVRGTTVGAERVDAGIDVHGSEAGNLIDALWSTKGIFAFDLGTGVPRFTGTTSDAEIPVGPQPCFGAVGTGGGQGDCPLSGVLANEGRSEAREFAAGAFALFRVALDYSDDVTAPDVQATGPSSGAISARFGFTANEPSEIHYTTDGSTPTLSSTRWSPTIALDEDATLRITQTTTVQWLAVDVKGNQQAVRSKTITIGVP